MNMSKEKNMRLNRVTSMAVLCAGSILVAGYFFMAERSSGSRVDMPSDILLKGHCSAHKPACKDAVGVKAQQPGLVLL